MLICTISEANVGWGSPRIVGEPRKLRIDVSKSTVERYQVVSRKPPSPTWKAFVERMTGSIRRDCLDHVIELNERHLKRVSGGITAHAARRAVVVWGSHERTCTFGPG